MDEFINFFQPTRRIGTAGQPRPDQFATIASNGYTVVVNLAMHDSDNAIREEGSIVAALGMSYFHIPVPFERPTARHLRQFFGVMDAIKDERVFVHCAVNARVSAFVYQYLTLKEGLEPESATSPLLAQWRPRMDDAWRSVMALRREDLES